MNFTTWQICILIYMASSLICRSVFNTVLKKAETDDSEMSKMVRYAKPIISTFPYIPIINTVYAAIATILFMWGFITNKNRKK